MSSKFKARLLASTLALTGIAGFGARPALADMIGWPPSSADPNGYYSANDHQGYFDRSGAYHYLQAPSGPPPMAQESAPIAASATVSFDSFHDELAHYGDWVYSDRWGEVWIPENVPADFHPYGTHGHWVYTDGYGWTWASDYGWGDITFHYGRWVNDPDNGWVWLPGYVWSPGWVVWRSNGQYTGWMPMPPDDSFLQGGGVASIGISLGGGAGVSVDFGDTGGFYGYSRWYPGYDENRFASNWTFVGTGHMADTDYGHFMAPRDSYVSIIHNTTNITHYTVVNNYIVNQSVDVHQVERAAGHPIVAAHIAQVIHAPGLVMHADTGRKLQMSIRQANPRGMGLPGSAPKPSAEELHSLSTNLGPHAAKGAAHLYTRETVLKAPLPAKPIVNPMPETGPKEPMGGPAMKGEMHEAPLHGMTGPSGGMAMPSAPGNALEKHEEMNTAKPAPMMEAPKEPTGGGMMEKHEEMNATKPAASPMMGSPQEPMGGEVKQKHQKHEDMNATQPAAGSMMEGPKEPMGGETQEKHQKHESMPGMEMSPAPEQPSHTEDMHSMTGPGAEPTHKESHHAEDMAAPANHPAAEGSSEKKPEHEKKKKDE